MQQYSLGAIYILPSGANPTPIPFGILKDASVEVDQEKTELRGQFKGALDVADGDLSIGLKIGTADFRASSLAILSSGATTVTGSKLVSVAESFVIPATPFQVTVAQSATFVEDGGVNDITAGKWLTRVASAPATGQYSVAAGVYTFAAADTTHTVNITYSYSSATVGSTTTFNNRAQEASTGYLVRIYNVYKIQGVLRPLGYEFPNVHFSKLSIALKVKDWAQANLEGKAAQDSTGLLFKSYVGE